MQTIVLFLPLTIGLGKGLYAWRTAHLFLPDLIPIISIPIRNSAIAAIKNSRPLNCVRKNPNIKIPETIPPVIAMIFFFSLIGLPDIATLVVKE